MNRRTFLRRGLQIGAVSAAVAAGIAFEERSTQPPATTTTLQRSLPATPTAWAKLAASLSGSLVLPSDRSYANDRLLYNSKFVDLHPRAIAYCATPDDVARCIDYATSHSVPLVARSGGHSYGGYSSCSGLVLDVSSMNAVSVDTTRDIATVGAGARLIDVYNAVGGAGRLLPAGSCPTVGIAGLALGGGIGVFSRKYSMTCDNIYALDVVTADARRLTADGANHSDLLWASRGAGGGNYAVATSFQFTVHPMPEVTLFTLEYPWEAAASMLDAWQRWITTTPDELWSNCLLLSEGTAGYLAQVSGVFCGPPAALSALTDALESLVGSAPISRFTGTDDYLSAMEIEAGCSGLTIAACHLATQSPQGRLGHTAYAAKSSYVDGPLGPSRVHVMVGAVEHLKELAPSLGGGLAFDAYGGAINRVTSDATAFVHRDKLACIQATYSWSGFSRASERAGGREWLTWLGTDVFDPTSGAYQNYIDPTLADWPNAYYGSNLDRLVALKAKYDPDDVFSFAQSIPLTLR